MMKALKQRPPFPPFTASPSSPHTLTTDPECSPPPKEHIPDHAQHSTNTQTPHLPTRRHHRGCHHSKNHRGE
ncbi:hypothetical protein E2C01_073082 [Portunus trituberculatus]|uniref:Uncharacterized protein n=1 Tax=Portunus trituberculatus TaxID=210409 RepID=A0A5B7HZU4_PORTR|nr:hypothetical protein [Portunus trituberculatus]